MSGIVLGADNTTVSRSSKHPLPSWSLHPRRRETEPENIFVNIRVKNFPNMGKETLIQVQGVQRVPYRKNPRRNTSRHTVIKLTKLKE